MAERKYDCIVVGSGPGGYVAAIRATQVGMKTAVVEKDRIGGRCLNYACIPAKAVLRVAEVFAEARDAERFGVQVQGASVDFPVVGAHRDKVIETLTGGVAGLFKRNKIDTIEGQGRLTNAGNVAVGDTEYEAGKAILATGSVSKPLLGLDFGGRVLDTAGAWLLGELPERLAVIGAGASGTEIASAYARLGTEVVLLEALPRILPLEDADSSRVCARELGKQGVKVVTGAKVESAKATKARVEIAWDGERERFDHLCIAAGRAPDVEGLGLDEAGVELGEDGFVKADGAMRTSKEGVYAIGDLAGAPALAHKASDEGVIAAEDAAGLDTEPIDYRFVPAVTFCHPQVASFGLTEEAAREAGHDVVVGKVPMGAVGAPLVYGDRTGMVKLVGDARYGELLGAHIVGVKAADMLQELVVAHDLEGGYAELARSIHAHPTFSEAVMEAARAADGWLVHG